MMMKVKQSLLLALFHPTCMLLKCKITLCAASFFAKHALIWMSLELLSQPNHFRRIINNNARYCYVNLASITVHAVPHAETFFEM